MKSQKSLYSRLTLITSVTLVVGYFVVYAAWTGILDSEIAPSATVTSTLMTKIRNNLEYLSGGLANFSFNSGKIGIGTSGPISNFEVWAGAQAGTAPVSVVSVLLGDNSTYSDGILSVKNAGNRGNIGNINGSPLFKASFTDATAMIIDKSGNVGIGTTAPGTRLSVVGAVGATAMSVGASANNWAETVYGSSAANQSFGTQITGGTSATDYGLIVYNYAQTIPMLAVRGDGNVGIGTLSPAYKLQVMGSVASNSTILTSDRRFKKNITPITSALDAIEKLQGVTFDWRIGEFTNRNFPAGKQIGFIAQEVEKVLPEVVTTDNDGYKGVEYANITAVLVEAVKELNTKNLKLEKEIQELKSK